MNVDPKVFGTGIIQDIGSANERRYIVTLSLSSWAHTQHDPCGIQQKYDTQPNLLDA